MSQVLRTIQAKGIQGLTAADRKKYVPPVGGFGAVSIPFIDQLALADVTPNAYGPVAYQFSQARIVADHVMTEVSIHPFRPPTPCLIDLFSTRNYTVLEV